MKFDIKDHVVVGEIMTEQDWVPLRVWVKAKIIAIQMRALFESRKDKEVKEIDFYKNVFESQFTDIFEHLEKENKDIKFYVDVYFEENDDDDMKPDDQDDQ